jgi:hypothetical protein
MSEPIDGSPLFSEADDATIQEIVREAESYLSSQLTASIAADQRAIAFASVLGAATAVVMGTGGTLLLGAVPDIGIGWTCMGVAAALLVAMALANLSAMPANFWYVGNSPTQWIDDVRSKRPLRDSLAEQLVHYSEMIADNDKLMRRNNKQMLGAIWTAWAALTIGGTIVIVFIVNRQYFNGDLFCTWMGAS